MKKKHSHAFTMIPNVIFDHWMNIVSPAQFKVLLFICRRTLGWGEKSIGISLKEFMTGTGLSRDGVRDSLNALIKIGVINKQKRTDALGGNISNSYELNIEKPLDSLEKGGGGNKKPHTKYKERFSPLHQGIPNLIYPPHPLVEKPNLPLGCSQSHSPRNSHIDEIKYINKIPPIVPQKGGRRFRDIRKSFFSVDYKEREPRVFTSDYEHEKLIEKKGGEEKAKEVYIEISRWKQKRQVEKSNDYQLAINWSLPDHPQKRTETPKESIINENRCFAIGVVEKLVKSNVNTQIEVLSKYVEIPMGPASPSFVLSYSEAAFKEQLTNKLRKMGCF